MPWRWLARTVSPVDPCESGPEACQGLDGQRPLTVRPGRHAPMPSLSATRLDDPPSDPMHGPTMIAWILEGHHARHCEPGPSFEPLQTVARTPTVDPPSAARSQSTLAPCIGDRSERPDRIAARSLFGRGSLRHGPPGYGQGDSWFGRHAIRCSIVIRHPSGRAMGRTTSPEMTSRVSSIRKEPRRSCASRSPWLDSCMRLDTEYGMPIQD